MNLQERINEFTNNIIKYAAMRKDRSSNVFCLSNLYNSLCSSWNSVIPDLIINRMLDGKADDEDPKNAHFLVLIEFVFNLCFKLIGVYRFCRKKDVTSPISKGILKKKLHLQ